MSTKSERSKAAAAMGSSRSKAKQEAARANGAKGGRPPKFGWLVDSDTTERIRHATEAEHAESHAAGPEGHIRVDGRRCYVED